MRKQESQNKKVDQLAKRLMGHAMLTESEIDKIVSSPMLYSSIRNKVNAAPAVKQRFAWFRVPAVAALASVLAIVGVTVFVVVRNGATPATTAQAPTKPAVTTSPITKYSEPDGIGLPKAEKVEQPQREDSKMQVQNASYRKPVAASPRPLKPRVEKQPDLEFIPLVYTEDPAESVKGGRVIRVELSRASLFAMGINVPLENGAETVKADLLVGQDGVPRGIRMPQ